jgi:AAA+ superfamily predicted ATPase
LDGFDLSKRTVIIGATNRPEDLDAALQSRFSTTIHFGLPSEECRRGILKQYAKQLKEGEIKQLAAITQGLSGRDLRDICEVAERQWATMIIHGDAPSESLPPLDVYLTSVKARKESFM